MSVMTAAMGVLWVAVLIGEIMLDGRRSFMARVAIAVLMGLAIAESGARNGRFAGIFIPFAAACVSLYLWQSWGRIDGAPVALLAVATMCTQLYEMTKEPPGK